MDADGLLVDHIDVHVAHALLAHVDVPVASTGARASADAPASRFETYLTCVDPNARHNRNLPMLESSAVRRRMLSAIARWSREA